MAERRWIGRLLDFRLRCLDRLHELEECGPFDQTDGFALRKGHRLRGKAAGGDDQRAGSLLRSHHAVQRTDRFDVDLPPAQVLALH